MPPICDKRNWTAVPKCVTGSTQTNGAHGSIGRAYVQNVGSTVPGCGNCFARKFRFTVTSDVKKNSWSVPFRQACKNADFLCGRREQDFLVIGSKDVEHAVTGLLGGFQSIAEVQELVLHRAAVHVVDGPAHVANQSFEFEAVHGDDFDVRTRLAGLQGKCDSFERISVSQEQRAFFRGELHPDRLSFHQARLPVWTMR